MPSSAKRAAFIDNLRRNTKGKLTDVVVMCYVEICKAATCVARVEGGSLRAIIPGVEAELKERLFDVSRPIPLGGPMAEDGLMDQKLLTECFTVLYKLNPWSTLKGLVPSLLDPSASPLYRVVLAKACYSIVSEENPMPWNPHMDASLGPHLRALFLENLNRDRFLDPKSKKHIFQPVDKRKRAQMDEAFDRMEIVLNILKTWCQCPLLTIARETSIIGPEELRTLFTGITTCLLDPSPSIRSAAGSTLLRLFDPTFIPNWDGTRPEWHNTVLPDHVRPPTEPSMRMFWRLGSQVVMNIARSVLELRADVLDFTGAVGVARNLLDLLRDLLSRRNDFLRSRLDFASLGNSVPDRFAASVAMEVALLVFLCSADVGISATAARCLGCLVEEAEITGEAGSNVYEGKGVHVPVHGAYGSDSSSFMTGSTMHDQGTPQSPTALPAEVMLPVVENIAVYRELQAMFGLSAATMVTGQKAQQKRIRKVLRNVRVPTAGNMGAWEEVYRRWRGLSQAVTTRGVAGGMGKQPDDIEDKDKKFKPKASHDQGAFLEDTGEWQNYTGFLCALGGVCLEASELAMIRNGGIDVASLNRRTSANFQNAAAAAAALVGGDGLEGPYNHPGSGAWTGVVGQQLMSAFSHARATVERFVGELVELMVCDNVVVREAVKEFLGAEIGGGLHVILFGQFEQIVSHFFDASGEAYCTDRNTLFVENTISVLKLTLDRFSADSASRRNEIDRHHGSPAGAVTTAFGGVAANIDFSSLVLTFIQYLNRLEGQAGQAAVAMRIKVRLCQLVEVVIAKKDLVSLRHEVRFRNKVVEAFLEWNSEFSMKSSDPNIPDDPTYASQSLKLHRDLDVASMKAMMMLLSGLPLLPELPSPQESAETDKVDVSNEAKSRLFYKYLSFFLKVLQKCRVLETVATQSHAAGQNSDLQALLYKSKETVQHLAPLKEHTIMALSNLLSANIDIGLRYSLSMGYHEDSKTRAAFMQVLTNVLGMGAVERFSGLGDEAQSVHERYDKLVEVVTGRGMGVALALCEVAGVGDVDEIANVLINVFEGRGRVLDLITKVVEIEVANTDTPTNLFRRNSMATRLLTIYARQTGLEYLRLTIQPLLDELLERGAPMSFEVDPVKLSPHDDPELNLRNLKMVAQAFLDSILGNVAHVPKPLRDACCLISRVVGSKFPGARMTAVGGFLFLRFFCPAIVAPEYHDLVKSPIDVPQLRRGLVLTTKVVQNLANNVLFGVKESFMAGLNDVLRDNYSRVHGFLKDVSTPLPYNPNGDAPRAETRIVDGMDIMRLHRHLALNLDKIERLQGPSTPGRGGSRTMPDSMNHITRNISTLDIGRSPEPDEGATNSQSEYSPEEREATLNRTALADAAAFSELADLLSSLGPPPDVSRLEMAMGRSEERAGPVRGLGGYSGGRVGPSRMFVEFMSRVEARPGCAQAVEEMKEAEWFFEGGIDKSGRPVFYYIARRVLPDSMDMELVLYFILLCLKPAIGKAVDVVIDVTQFSAENEWQLGWLQRFEKLLPFDMIRNMHTVFIFNANTALRKYAKRSTSVFTSKLARRVLFLSSLGELGEHIAPGEQRLPKSTVALERDVNAVFQPAARVVAYRDHVPVVVRLTPETVQIAALKKQEVLGYGAILNDILHVSEIDELALPGRQEDILIIRYAEKVGGSFAGASAGVQASNVVVSSITLSSPKREMIAQAIRAAKARHQLSKPGNITDQRHLRPSDVPGTLLNMALLNLGSEEANLRVASYNLLYALSTSFDFDIASRLLDAKGLCIPPNNQTFVVELSRRLAETKPSLTLELLLECCIGFQKASKELKHFCLEYMAPWLANLRLFGKPGGIAALPNETAGDEQGGKLREIVKMMIDVTVKEHEMFPLLQSKFWHAIGDADDIMPIVLDSFIQSAISHGLGANQTEVLANTLITLASVNSYFIPGKIISRLRKAIASTSIHCAPTLVDHPTWNEIAVLLRFVLMLSFNDRLNVRQFLPELFHVVSMLVGIGAPIVRSSVHGIVVNTVQTLCTAGDLDQTSLATLRVLLSEFSDERTMTLFGLGGTGLGQSQYGNATDWSVTVGNSAFLFTGESLNGEMVRDVPLGSLETIVNSLLDVMTYGAADAELSATWKSRWMSLIASTAFQYNPAIQPRAFIALGCLARDDVDDDLLYQILVALRGALTLFEENECHLIVSIIMSLCNIVAGLPEDSRYLRPMFWLAMALIQIGHQPIFQGALTLLTVVLRTLNGQGCFDEEGMVAPLLRARAPIHDVAAELDAAVGIHFTSDFAFAAASNLLKGIKHASSKSATVSALTTMLEISSQPGVSASQNIFGSSSRVSREKIGFILPLLSSTERLEDLFWLAGASDPDLDYYDGEDIGVAVAAARRTGAGANSLGGDSASGITVQSAQRYKRILERFDIFDPSTAILSVSLIVTMLENAEYEAEVLFMYGFLAEAALAVPEVFVLVYDSLLPRMTQILASSQTPQVLEAVQAILKTMVSRPATAIPFPRFNPTASQTSMTGGQNRRSVPPPGSQMASSPPGGSPLMSAQLSRLLLVVSMKSVARIEVLDKIAASMMDPHSAVVRLPKNTNTSAR
ncbi:Ras GTPase activating protein ira2 [Rhizophlyctis rosea]|uniref:Ras GTPase activating protein ira2 n=1 Tax=Rhizophlyctis rosea TaxID=64517 RepID=A0AAD5SKP4_9FUNG|nr:Ras GTPase activating protein ira2 [Rhizophlyctis rosea]